MSEAETLENPVQEAEEATPTADVSPEPKEAPAGTLGGGKEAEEAKEAGPDLQAIREQMAGGDKGLLKQLERQATLEDIGKSYQEKEKKLREKQQPLTLKDEATKSEIEAYRKAVGIPESAEEYPVSFSEGIEPSEADTALLGAFKQTLFDKAGDPRTAALAVQWYEENQEQVRQDREAVALEREKETIATLKAEYGAEYDGNLSAASQIMKSTMGAEAFAAFTDKRFEDGTRWQDDPDFVRMMVKIGVDQYGGTGTISGDPEKTSQTVEEKLEAFDKMLVEDPDKYFSDEVQAEVAKLTKQKERLSARAA